MMSKRKAMVHGASSRVSDGDEEVMRGETTRGLALAKIGNVPQLLRSTIPNNKETLKNSMFLVSIRKIA